MDWVSLVCFRFIFFISSFIVSVCLCFLSFVCKQPVLACIYQFLVKWLPHKIPPCYHHNLLVHGRKPLVQCTYVGRSFGDNFWHGYHLSLGESRSNPAREDMVKLECKVKGWIQNHNQTFWRVPWSSYRVSNARRILDKTIWFSFYKLDQSLPVRRPRNPSKPSFLG